MYKGLRRSEGRRALVTVEALGSYDKMNAAYRNYFTHLPIEREKSLISKVKTTPKLFYSYIRSKKVDATSVGPLKIVGGVISSDC